MKRETRERVDPVLKLRAQFQDLQPEAGFLSDAGHLTFLMLRPATIGLAARREQQCAGTTMWRTSSGAPSLRIPCPISEWDLGAFLPEPLRVTTRGRLVFFDSQCLMGTLQPFRRLPARLSCRQLQSAQDPARARPGGWHPGHVANACPHIRTVPRGAVSLAFFNKISFCHPAPAMRLIHNKMDV